jgi:hypothetical protein
MTVSRDPEEYWPTDRAVLRKKKRGIEWANVSEAISNGRVNKEGSDDTCVFTKQFDDRLLYVAANFEQGAIASVWAEHKD